MKIIVHTVAIDSDYGTSAWAFATEQEAEQAVVDFLDPEPEALAEYASGKIDLCDLWERESKHLDTWSSDYAVLNVSFAQILRQTVRSRLDSARCAFRAWKRKAFRHG